MEFASNTRIRNGMLPRLRFSRVVWLILISQVLSLAVVSTILWDFRKDLGNLTIGVDDAFSISGPVTLTGPSPETSSGDPNRPLPTLLPPRIIGETHRILDCITDALLARRMAARLLASQQLAGSVDPGVQDIKCDEPSPDKQPGKENGPPGGK